MPLRPSLFILFAAFFFGILPSTARADDPRLRDPSVEVRLAALQEHSQALAEYRRENLRETPVALLLPLYQALKDRDLRVALPAFNWVELYSGDRGQGERLFKGALSDRDSLDPEVYRRISMRFERNRELRYLAKEVVIVPEPKRPPHEVKAHELVLGKPPANSSAAFLNGFSGNDGMIDALRLESVEARREAMQGFSLFLGNARIRSRVGQKMKTPPASVELLRELARNDDPQIASSATSWLNFSLGINVCASVASAEGD